MLVFTTQGLSARVPFDSNMGVFVSGNEIVMDWDSSPSFNCVVSETANLVSAVWTVENTLPGNGSVMSFTNSITDPSAFFKVEAVYS